MFGLNLLVFDIKEGRISGAEGQARAPTVFSLFECMAYHDPPFPFLSLACLRSLGLTTQGDCER